MKLLKLNNDNRNNEEIIMKVTIIVCIIVCACFTAHATGYVLQNGVNGYTGCQDTWIWENTDGNHGGQDFMQFYRNSIRPLTATYVPMIQFDISQFDTSTYFDTATLSVYVTAHMGEAGVTPSNEPTEYRAYLMLLPWNAGTADPEAFGDPEVGAVDFFHREYPTKGWGPGSVVPGTYGPWIGDDYSASYYALSIKPDTSTNVWLDFDVKTLAQFWVENPSANNGVIIYLESNTAPPTVLRLSSSDHATVSEHPKLTLVTGTKPVAEDVQQSIIRSNGIQWDANISSEYKVYYSTDGGSNWDVLVDSIIADTTPMSVVDDPTPLDSRQYKVEKIEY
jgi:hypothetical protein